MATLSHSDLMTLWVLNGGSQALADTAAAVAQAESGGCQYAKHGPFDDRPVKECSFTFSTGENSYGLWQINRQAHPQFSPASLYTTAGNAKAAVSLATGSEPFYPWTTWKDGTYKRYLTGTVSTTPQPGSTFTPTATGTVPQSFRGWLDADRALAMHLPTNLRKSDKLTRAALATLHKAGVR